MESVAACTIVGANYLPLARVLSSSYLAQHPDHVFVVAIIDQDFVDNGPFPEGVICKSIGWIREATPEFDLMAMMYDVTEFATSLKPFVLRRLLDSYELVTYIDPDIRIYNPISDIVSATQSSGWSLTPHCLAPMARDGLSPRESDVMMAGIYNLGFIGVASQAVDLLDWWCERLRRDSISDPQRQLFTDQRWIDLAVPIFHPHIEKSPAFNVAYWNVDQRPLRMINDEILVDGEALKFFHFSGFDAAKPWILSKHAGDRPRALVSSSEVLRHLCSSYAGEVIDARKQFANPSRYRWSQPIPGFDIPLAMRRLFRRELIEFDNGSGSQPPSPFAGPATDFLEWLSARPTQDQLPRYAQVVLDARPDVQALFGREVEAGDLSGLNHWIEYVGVGDLPWLNLVRRDMDGPRQVPLNSNRERRPGVDVVGYLRSEHGVGEAGRLVAKALATAGVDVASYSSSRTSTRQNTDIIEDRSLSRQVTILSVNADQTPIVIGDLGVGALDRSYVIGQWFWELEEFPNGFEKSFELVDEVWVATTFVADAVRKKAPARVQVTVMPLPIVRSVTEPSFSRGQLGLDDRFLFLFSFDMLSVLERKNPLGVIEAYMQAFTATDGAQLVIKMVNGQRDVRGVERLRWAISGRPDIHIIDGYLDRPVLASLTESSDCYVSLHRSEGLGLTMAEAMAFGVPVIATGYSGNVDFMNDRNSILVPWKHIKVGPSADPYHPDSLWAEPDLDFASGAMRRMFDDRSFAGHLGRAGREFVESEFSLEVCGARMLRRLNEINHGVKNGESC